MESIETKSTETQTKRFTRKGSQSRSIRFTFEDIEFIKEQSQAQGISQADFIRNLLDKGLEKSQESGDHSADQKQIEKLENLVNNLLDFYMDLAVRGVITEEDAERLNQIQEGL